MTFPSLCNFLLSLVQNDSGIRIQDLTITKFSILSLWVLKTSLPPDIEPRKILHAPHKALKDKFSVK